MWLLYRSFLVLEAWFSLLVAASNSQSKTVTTGVAILGGGMAGIIAARTLHEQGVNDYVIIEGRDELGGRMQDVALGNGVRIELGANWVQGLGEGKTQNPIYTLALKNNLRTVFSNFSNLTTFDHSGPVDMDKELDAFGDAWTAYLAAAGDRVEKGQGDLTARAGLAVSGYKPRTYLDDASEYCTFDFEFAQTPEESSFLASADNYNFTYNGFSSENNLVVDQRGFKTIALTEAASFLNASDARVHLGQFVTDISYSSNGVTIKTKQGWTIIADYAICTFSIGVLQHDDVKFHPSLPAWKQEAIDGTNMAIYTKIFLRFPTTFWPNAQFLVYADPSKRGYYTVWQSLDLPDLLPGSQTIFATVTGRESLRIERQSDSATKEEMMTVLRSMFPDVDVPEPLDMVFKRWHADPLFRGTYSNWGAAYAPAVFDGLRAPLEQRLWFAGEATSFKYYGFLQGAYFEGMDVATHVVQCMGGHCPVNTKASRHVVKECGKTFLDEADLAFR